MGHLSSEVISLSPKVLNSKEEVEIQPQAPPCVPWGKQWAAMRTKASSLKLNKPQQGQQHDSNSEIEPFSLLIQSVSQLFSH